MVQAITATYVQEEDDWTITVAGLGKELKGRAPGIIAARDRADQLVEKLVPDGNSPTVVHLLRGSALEFTTAYMTARLARPEPVAEQPAAEEDTPATDAQATANSTDSADVVDTVDADGDENPATVSEETEQPQSTTPAEARQVSTEPETPEQSGKRAVPRKELSKSPGNATANPRTSNDEGRQAGGAYVSSAAGSLPRAAGSASAAG
ncbi:hypothetical protein BAY61_25100 [Prauserella marina]|uniref:Uncharacterized protein n=1 Tax=Prauserella marina TaxID=530584 RepID=A0A222W0T0_9PSEU|nr:hypothetical protein BAY61_25100 [Prauserella marina]PWV75680.1 hypothetical protein DES30_106297 [Prauserella marina]SDD28936.1 hypothetical protein SAMN05421630_107144 [Prauserella marina]